MESLSIVAPLVFMKGLDEQALSSCALFCGRASAQEDCVHCGHSAPTWPACTTLCADLLSACQEPEHFISMALQDSGLRSSPFL